MSTEWLDSSTLLHCNRAAPGHVRHGVLNPTEVRFENIISVDRVLQAPHCGEFFESNCDTEKIENMWKCP